MTKTSILSIACVMALGCAETIPPELADARQAYARAQEGPAAKHNPSELHAAHDALKKAEVSFDDEGDSFKTRDRSYIAARKSRIAEIHARTMESEQRAAKIRQQTEELEDAALAKLGSSLQSQGQALASERALREDAERRAEQARAELSRIAQVGQTDRGTVITLPGGVLFASGKSVLLGSAESKLSQVAQTLASSSPNAKMEVEGHTDSRGSDSSNQKLSEQRAQAVRDYLVTRGVASERITAKGLGESRPIADNESPEGRANNRRVEIVVQNTPEAAPGANSMGAAPGSAGGISTGNTGATSTTGNTGASNAAPTAPRAPSTPSTSGGSKPLTP